MVYIDCTRKERRISWKGNNLNIKFQWVLLEFRVFNFSAYTRLCQHFLFCVGVHSVWQRINFWESVDLWCAASKADMINSIVDRLYRPIRISNRMRLAKLLLLLLLLPLEGSSYDPSIHISSCTLCHHRRQQVKRHKRIDTSLIHAFHVIAIPRY